MSIAYVDESGFAHDMTKTYEYSRIGGRYYDSCDWNAKGRKMCLRLYMSHLLLDAV